MGYLVRSSDQGRSRKNSYSITMDALKEWVEHHMAQKTSEDLWYLSDEILKELTQRDSVQYRVTEDVLEEDTHDSEGC